MSKLAMRRTWFQVHKWIGLILAILIIPISLTGSALVWHDALDRAINPVRNAVSGDALLPPTAYVAAARVRLGAGERIALLTMPEHGGPVIVTAARAATTQPGPPARTMLYLDPPTARVLEVSSSRGGVVQTLHRLHGSLLIPGVGRQIVGWIGVAMMVSAFTGLWLWWPTAGNWIRGLRWRRHRDLDTNLHHQIGFWVAVPLFVLSLTGAWISFPAFFVALLGQTAQRGGGGPDRAAMARAKPLEAPALPLDTVIAQARTLRQGELQSIAWPTDLKADWTVTLTGTLAGESPTAIAVADDSGIPALAPPRGQAGVARLMRRIHDGTDMGFLWQVVIFVGGILPAILSVTGIIMWSRARGWKAERAKLRKMRRVAAAE